MTRGPFAIFGTSEWSTLNTLKSFTNFYNVPYVSWSYLDRKPFYSMNQIKSLNSKITNHHKSYSNSYEKIFLRREDYDLIEQKTFIKIQNHTNMNSFKQPSYQLFLKPDLVPVLIELIRFYDWKHFYYIYNYENGNNYCFKLFTNN
jgi:hypothetical protein